VMPLTRSFADALNVLTIFLVASTLLLGVFCILYSVYFHLKIQNRDFVQLDYFAGPWITRITYVLFVLWWGLGEISRLTLLKQGGKFLGSLSSKWQENICKVYVVSNIGFSEPCLLLTVVFLLHASLKKSGPLNPNWNSRTASHVLLFGFTMLLVQLAAVLIAPKFFRHRRKLPSYFVESAATAHYNHAAVVVCTCPLLSTIIFGFSIAVLSSYLLWIGKRAVDKVINRGLQKRVYVLVLSSYGLFPLRVIALGLSVVPRAGGAAFEGVVFFGFVSVLVCVLAGMYVVVYLPAADSLA
ncbi:hypothetical protein M569_12344, partial [Genlisea aurea]